MAVAPGKAHVLNDKPLQTDETAAVCVPSGYTIWPGLRNSTEYSYFLAGVSVTKVPGQEFYDGVSEVPAFEVRWRTGDLDLVRGTTGTGTIEEVLPSFVPGGPTTVFPSATSTAAPAGVGSSDGNSRLSASAIAGIVIGALLGIALVAGGLWFLKRYRRTRKRSSSEGMATEIQTVHDGLSELTADQAAMRAEKAELDAVEVDSSEATGPSSEKPAGFANSIVEMDTAPVQSHQVPDSGPSDAILSAHLPSPGPRNPQISIFAPDTVSQAAQVQRRETPPAVDPEVAQLMEKKARLDERRRRLMELESLDSEAAAIEQRLNQIQGRGR